MDGFILKIILSATQSFQMVKTLWPGANYFVYEDGHDMSLAVEQACPSVPHYRLSPFDEKSSQVTS